MRWIVLRMLLAWCVGTWSIDAALAQQTVGTPGRPAPGTAPAPVRPAPATNTGDPNAPQARAVDPEAARKMEELLVQWEQRSQNDKTLYAQFTRTDKSDAWPTPKKFEGQALLQSPNLACLDFQEVTKDHPKGTFHERIICSTDSKVYQFLGPTKQVFVYPLAREERRRALEEGPLPFLFNMKVDEAKRRYHMDLVQERPAANGKAGAYVIRIIPIQAIDREEFSQALVLLNQETFLPDALQLYSPSGKDTKTFVFKKVVRNATLLPSNFDGAGMAAKFRAQGYKVVENPDASGRPQGTMTETSPGARPAPQPALRPGVNPGRRR